MEKGPIFGVLFVRIDVLCYTGSMFLKVLLCFFFVTPLWAQQEIKELQQLMSPYYEGAQMDVVKKVYMSLLEKEKTLKGTMWIFKDALKISFHSPEKSLVVVNRHFVWIEQPLATSGKIQVTKIKLGKRSQISRSPLAFLFQDPTIWSQFKVKKRVQNSAKEYLLIPKNKAQLGNVKKVQLRVEHKRLSILAYWDDLDNRTMYFFKNTKFFKGKMDKKQFQYSPPKGATITVLN